MKKWGRFLLVGIFLGVCFLVAVQSQARAEEWVYTGICSDPYYADRQEFKMEIRIKGDPEGKTFEATIYNDGILMDWGTYYPKSGRIRTEKFDGQYLPEQKAFRMKGAGQDRIVGYCEGDVKPPGFDSFELPAPPEAPTPTPTPTPASDPNNVFVGTWSCKAGISIVVNADHTGSWVDPRPNTPGTWIGKWDSSTSQLFLTPDDQATYGGTVTFTLEADGTMHDIWGDIYSK